MYCICPTRRKKGRRGLMNKKQKMALKSQKTFCKKMGCGENKLMAQQVQETVHTDMKRR